MKPGNSNWQQGLSHSLHRPAVHIPLRKHTVKRGCTLLHGGASLGQVYSPCISSGQAGKSIRILPGKPNVDTDWNHHGYLHPIRPGESYQLAFKKLVWNPVSSFSWSHKTQAKSWVTFTAFPHISVSQQRALLHQRSKFHFRLLKCLWQLAL